ncbi:MAG: multiheme c-type cytochrome [Sandaracinaceae bacterium]
MVEAPKTPRTGLIDRLLAPFRSAPEPAPERSPFRLMLDVIFGRRARSLALGCMVALGGCEGERIEVEGVVRDGRTGRPIAGAVVSTHDGRRTETDDEGRFAVEVEEGHAITAEASERCPATEAVGARTPRVTLNLFDALELETEHDQVGFDSDVRIEVRARCELGGPLRWSQVAGPTLPDGAMRVEDDGHLLVVHTHALDQRVPLDDRVGIVPLDRDARAEYRFRMEWDGAPRDVRVTAAPVSAGLYQVPTGADLYLNGGAGETHDWVILNRPDNSEAALSDARSRTPHFRPDEFGTYLVEHRPTHTQMSIQAGAYEDVPRDCGREGCHGAEAEGWTTTAHARTFERGLRGELGPEFAPACWSCHATGVDVGVDNGGLHQTASQLGWSQPAPDAGVWESAPRRMRRHGSVWCSACHGPGRIVPPPYRWQYGAKLQVGVCARCHDVDDDDPAANHVSPHVDEWERAAMSSFVRDLREDDPARRAGCASCHSAQGFVEWRRRSTHAAPDPLTVQPITCGACHDAHDASRPFAVRVHDTSDPIDGQPGAHMGTGALCASCHRAASFEDTPPVDRAPHAPQANVLMGRGARLASDDPNGAHRWIADTCVRCHMARPAAGDALRGRAGGHTFAMRGRNGAPEFNAASCAGCHGDAAPETIGARDWDGDGQSGAIAEEFDRAMAQVSARLSERVQAASIEDACGRVAVDVTDFDARLVLVASSGALLGDCDEDGRFGQGETAVTVTALSNPVREAAYDLAMIRRDGSRGVHHPNYAFAVLASVADSL